LKNINLLFLLGTIAVILHSCAFPKTYTNNSILTEHNLASLNGQYNFMPQTDSSTNLTYIESDYANERFYRCSNLKGRYCFDTTQIDFVDKYSFKLNIQNKENLEISYFRDTTLFRQLMFKFKLTNDGFLLIKNRNFRVLGLPYIIGGIDIKKRRLSLENGNLVIDEVYHSSGGTLIIFSDSKTWTSRNKYTRVR
jgi:hypothetical protein